MSPDGIGLLAVIFCGGATYALGRWASKKLGNVTLVCLLALPWLWTMISLLPELTSRDEETRGWGGVAVIIIFFAYSGYASFCLIGFMFGRIANTRLNDIK